MVNCCSTVIVVSHLSVEVLLRRKIEEVVTTIARCDCSLTLPLKKRKEKAVVVFSTFSIDGARYKIGFNWIMFAKGYVRNS